jgi:PilZ domain
MSEERRQVYRVMPQPGDPITLHLRVDGAMRPADEVLDVSARGACARVQAPVTPIARGERVEVSLGTGAGPTVDVEAVVASARTTARGYRYGLRFLNEATAPQPGEQAFHRTFNRRGLQRATDLADARPLMVLLLAEGVTGAAHSARALLRNISASGLGAITDLAAASWLTRDQDLRAGFTLPGAGRPLDLGARLRSRHAVGSSVYVGLAFEPRRTRAYLEQAEEIVAFVIGRQQGERVH